MQNKQTRNNPIQYVFRIALPLFYDKNLYNLIRWCLICAHLTGNYVKAYVAGLIM